MSAAVINDNNAAVTTETLRFYLKGIFSDADALDWIQSRLSRKMIGRTFEDVEKNIELLLSKGQRSRGINDADVQVIRGPQGKHAK